MFGAGLSLRNSVVFAVGLLAGNVPEGLLPVITLALAVAVRSLARRGALVKRLSAVETLGCTDVICTDKTGTLTENRMRPVAIWTPTVAVEIENEQDLLAQGVRADPSAMALAAAGVACNNARLQAGQEASGDPTEIGVLRTAQLLGADGDAQTREHARRGRYGFDPALKLMTTLDATRTGCAHTPRVRPRACFHAAQRRSQLTAVRSSWTGHSASRSPARSRTSRARADVCWALAQRSLPQRATICPARMSSVSSASSA